MMNEYMKKYREQMDRVKLSDVADQAIWDAIREADAQKKKTYGKWAKRPVKAAAIAATIVIASFATVLVGAAIHGLIVRSNKTETRMGESGAKVEIEESDYFDLLAGDGGQVYVLTNNEKYESALTDRHQHIVVWKSADQGDTWEEVLPLPEELKKGSFLFAGDLWEGEEGVEAFVIIEDPDPKVKDGYVNRVYRITADSYEEYDMDEVYTRLGDQNHLFHIKYVNGHTIALVGTTQCLLYDTDTQKIVKSLPYDMTMGCLRTQEQFLLYGKEIYSCLDVETLQEQEPDPGLQEFVQTMYGKNAHDVFPPMEAQGDAVICATSAGVYEYQAGKMKQTVLTSGIVNAGRTFNGLLPICRGQEGEYYMVTAGEKGMSLWLVEDSGAEILK